MKNFLFHRVSPNRDPLWDPMDVALFDRCLSHISRHYQVVLFEEGMQDPGRLAKGRFASVMFDDGYKDNIEYAAPVLQKYKVKASFYVVTGCIDQDVLTWTHQLDYAFQFTAKTDLQLQYNFIPEALHITNLPTHKERLSYVKLLKPALKKLTHDQRTIVLQDVHRSFDDVSFPDLMMNWDDLRQLRQAGHYIGSHTVSHPMLGTINEEKLLMDELSLSGERIRAELGYFPATISYPVGSYNAKVKDLSRLAGYRYGLAVNQVPFMPGKQDAFEVPRMELYNESWMKTLMRIENLPNRLTRLWKKI